MMFNVFFQKDSVLYVKEIEIDLRKDGVVILFFVLVFLKNYYFFKDGGKQLYNIFMISGFVFFFC